MNNQLINHFTWLANKVSEVYFYKIWEDDFKVEKLNEAYNEFYKSLKENNIIDFNKLTKEEALELRFNLWSEESGIYLIPLYLAPLIPIGTELTSIMGDKIIFEGMDKIDLDHRFGCLAYGIKFDNK